MSTAHLQRPTNLQLAPSADHVAPPAVDIVVPVYNEAAGLAASVERLHTYLVDSFPFTFRVTIADNGSTDGTWELATDVARQYRQVRAVRLDESGRGRALHAVWSASDA